MEVIDGVEYYADIFDRHVKKGDELIVDKALAERSYFVFTRQKKKIISFNIYRSTEVRCSFLCRLLRIYWKTNG